MILQEIFSSRDVIASVNIEWYQLWAGDVRRRISASLYVLRLKLDWFAFLTEVLIYSTEFRKNVGGWEINWIKQPKWRNLSRLFFESSAVHTEHLNFAGSKRVILAIVLSVLAPKIWNFLLAPEIRLVLA